MGLWHESVIDRCNDHCSERPVRYIRTASPALHSLRVSLAENRWISRNLLLCPDGFDDLGTVYLLWGRKLFEDLRSSLLVACHKHRFVLRPDCLWPLSMGSIPLLGPAGGGRIGQGSPPTQVRKNEVNGASTRHGKLKSDDWARKALKLVLFNPIYVLNNLYCVKLPA